MDPELEGVTEWIDYWDGIDKVPERLKAFAEQSSQEFIPTAFAKHKKYGWVVIHAGQGSYIAMKEIE